MTSTTPEIANSTGLTPGWPITWGPTHSIAAPENTKSPIAPPSPTAMPRRSVCRYAASITATFTGPIGTPVSAPMAAPMRKYDSTSPCYSSGRCRQLRPEGRIGARRPARAESRSALADPAAVTWLGHATAVVELGGRRVLFDPLGRGRTRRAGAVDAVLITHSHVDHLNRWSLKAVDRDTLLVVPRGAGRSSPTSASARSARSSPAITSTWAASTWSRSPTKHDNGRWRKGDAPICAGYVVRADGLAVHHAGDVDFSDHSVFDDIGKRFDLDATLLPIGGMLPVCVLPLAPRAIDRGVHIDPDCALDIYQRLGARTLVPVHWGTVNLRLGGAHGPRRRLEEVVATTAVAGVRVLAHGEALPLGAP
jgi:L-ascorbate metabolism protein UlaG (beta-lactamase superfamily)